MKKLFFPILAVLFIAGCASPSGDQNRMFSEIQPISTVPVKIQVHKLDEDTFGVQVTGVTEATEVQGMDVAVQTPEGLKVTDINLNPELKDKDWIFVKNLEAEPVMATSVGTTKLEKDMDVLTVDVEGKSLENINVYVSIIEHGKSYGDAYPFSFSAITGN